MSFARRLSTLSILFPTLILMLCSRPRVEAGSAPLGVTVPVDEVRLDNGMTLLVVQRPAASTVAAGWMARVGSADDGLHRAGLSHLLEHLMFKGTRTLGSRDIESELALLEREDAAWLELRTLEERAATASVKTRRRLARRISELQLRFQDLQEQTNSLAWLGQFSLFYSELGATGLNANTLRDFTLYSVTVPSESLEAWFWLESNRLLEPVFRQFYQEIGVIHEERRMRIESTPTGELDEELRARFWQDHPYSWDPKGKPETLHRLSRPEAREFFARHYRADNITAALVGGFDPEQVERWARLYFGRLPGSTTARTGANLPRVKHRTSEELFDAVCQCPPQAQVLYPSVPFDHSDAAALQVLSAVMNGRSGRLHRSLVLAQQLAFSAFTRQIAWRRAGEFAFHGETKGDTDPRDLIAAWDRELGRLRAQPVDEAELARARNRLSADMFRSLKDPADLMRQLLIYQGLGDWRHLNRWTDEILAVTPGDLRRVAATYLVPERRTVALYRRAASQPGAPSLALVNPTNFGTLP